jgi:hypothetical protein
MIPTWLHDISTAYLLLGGLCAAFIAADIIRHPQPMWIMNIVWPVTALFGSLWIVWQYFTYGRGPAHQAMQHESEPPAKSETPFPIMVANGALHCGSGCTLGDIVAVWIVDYIFAYLFGVFFQFFTIAPMRGLSIGPGLVAAIKADTLSLTAWQVGMYGFMAFANFYLFPQLLGAALKTNTVEFWFMMQIAMIFGFITTYPVNWWLIRTGIKETM